MSIDWSRLPVLIGPRFKRLKAERGDRERLAATKHAKRKRPKNHATNKERSHLERARAAEVARAAADKRSKWLVLREQLRAYWRGEREDYPA